MRKCSLRILLVFLLVALVAGSSEAAKSRRRSKASHTPKAESVSIASLHGRWTASGNGTGQDPRQPGVTLSLGAEDVVIEIDNIKFSETTGEGQADVIFMGRITDIRNELRHVRSWAYSIPYDMKREGPNSWSFSTEFVDGEDKITLTLTNPNSAILRWEGANWDDDFPDERDTFDVTCTATKQ